MNCPNGQQLWHFTVVSLCLLCLASDLSSAQHSVGFSLKEDCIERNGLKGVRYCAVLHTGYIRKTQLPWIVRKLRSCLIDTKQPVSAFAFIIFLLNNYNCQNKDGFKFCMSGGHVVSEFYC